jgi:fibronectin-binding autotransporter adhesin
MSLVNSVVGTAGVNGGTNADPQVNRTGLTRGNLNNTFYIGSVNPGFTSLPLDLLYFKGFPDNGRVVLNWATASDDDAAWFMIQRSKDGSSWENWQRLQADSMGVAHYYSAVDPAPYSGVSFYRLQQSDALGNSLYSSVLAITQSASSGLITVYPVPATDHLTVSFPVTGNYLVELVNMLGQSVRQSLTSTGNSVSWLISGLSAGPYFVRIFHDGVTETKTVLIK